MKALGIQAKAVWRVLVDLQTLILQGQRISFRHSPTQSLNLQIYRFTDSLNIYGMIIRPSRYKKLLQCTFKTNKVGFRQDLNTFRSVWGLPDQTKYECGHKSDCCNVVSGFIRSTQHHLVAFSAGSRFRKLPVYLSWPSRYGTAGARPGEAGTITSASI